MNIAEAIKLLSAKSEMAAVAKVTAVDGHICAVAFEDGRPPLANVRLKSVIDNDGHCFLLKPAVSSYVIVEQIEGHAGAWQVSAYSTIDELSLLIDTTKLRVDKDGFLISRGSENLHDILSDLINAINMITVPTSAGPSGTPINAATFTKIANRLQKILKNA